jgi:NADPH:quinone reductase-like Zn-dependent oxidoreductase
MKAIILKQAGGVENLAIAEVPMPVPKKGEVLIKVNAISINPVDIKTRKGMGFYNTLQESGQVILGWDVSGEVVEAGEDATQFEIGEEVFGMVNFPGHGKAYAEYVTAPVAHLADKPDQITHQEAAASSLAALTAWQVLMQAKVQSGERVLMHAAAGGVGHFGVQIAKYLGAYVIGTGSDANYDFVKELGADEYVDYNHERFEEVIQKVDIVFDAVGGDNPKRSLDIIRSGGLLIAIAGGITDEVKKLAEKKGVKASAYLVQSNGDDMEQLAELLEAGTIRPFISKEFSFDQIKEAHTEIESGRTRGKIVISME